MTNFLTKNEPTFTAAEVAPQQVVYVYHQDEAPRVGGAVFVFVLAILSLFMPLLFLPLAALGAALSLATALARANWLGVGINLASIATLLFTLATSPTLWLIYGIGATAVAK